MTGPHQRLVRTRLANGLRVLLAPDRTVPVVAVAVHYDVGMRSEPEGRTGFAHLFEHLMFQGSERLPKLDHSRYVQSAGGLFNGSTHLDYTQYHDVLPSNALERALFLEADRMRAPDLNAENLRVQIDVVKEEIRVNVTNKPYGCFPWVHLPGALFRTFANSHDGYGSFADLDSATVADAHQFFDRYYAPANALLTVGGDFEPDEALAMVHRHFGPIDHRPAPPRPDFAEPAPTARRRLVHHDPHAPLPAVAAGWRVPDPVGRWADYLPHLLLTEVMSDGPTSRLHRRLVRTDRTAISQRCYLGMLGDPFDTADPTALVCTARQAPGADCEQVLDAVVEEFAAVAAHGPGERELARVAGRLTTRLMVETDAVLARTQALASLELRHGRAELLDELPELFAAVTPDQVRAAAARLTGDRCGMVELRPGAARAEGLAA
ncbi:M16 family metallopeptidase [Actinokineospora bangkokensis]|uniref:Peptidase M16 n=1 Tax=Actinokineospora bangkokensis TaxID=1193682 RepID=A0A1Q9LJY6_9PSEU|nr:pitrilysin family protein [Actinokineospora bangkokensis]OLR92330.1 peptidase M16 [Actinokineospora bangkokensis]